MSPTTQERGHMPPPDWDSSGWNATDRIRLRPTWFGFRIERLWRHADGCAAWRRVREAVQLTVKP